MQHIFCIRVNTKFFVKMDEWIFMLLCKVHKMTILLNAVMVVGVKGISPLCLACRSSFADCSLSGGR